MTRINGSATVAALVGLGGAAMIGVAGYATLTGNSLCSMFGSCSSGLDAAPTATVSLVEPPATQAEAAGEPVNATCPVSGAPIDPTAVAVHNGKTIAFCNGHCAADFNNKTDAEKDATLAMVMNVAHVEMAGEPLKQAHEKAGAHETQAGPINSTCPGSGMALVDGVTATFASYTVGFCCTNCQAAFEAQTAEERATYVAAQLAAKPVNASCPIMGHEVDASLETLAINGANVGVCCAGCIDTINDMNDEEKAQLLHGLLAETPSVNATCPVMGGAVSQDVFTVHNGAKVAYCCAGCDVKFNEMTDEEKTEYVIAQLVERHEAIASAHKTDTPAHDGE